ncbi:protein kinase, partial [Candidatus Margulisiibacteriota bacterium]
MILKGKFETKETTSTDKLGKWIKGVRKDNKLPVTIRFIPIENINPEVYNNLEEQLFQLGKLNHKGLFRIIDFELKNEGLYIIYQYITGNQLNTYLNKLSAFDHEVVHTIGEQLLNVLQYLHANQCFHGNCSPEYIYIQTDGSIKIIGYLTESLINTSCIQKGKSLIPNEYLTPSQVNNGITTPQSDIFSFGILMYYLLSGRHPYQKAETLAKRLKVLQSPPQLLSIEDPSLPIYYSEIIGKILNNPHESYPTIAALKKDWDRKSVLTTLTPPPPAPEETSTPEKPKARPDRSVGTKKEESKKQKQDKKLPFSKEKKKETKKSPKES